MLAAHKTSDKVSDLGIYLSLNDYENSSAGSGSDYTSVDQSDISTQNGPPIEDDRHAYTDLGKPAYPPLSVLKELVQQKRKECGTLDAVASVGDCSDYISIDGGDPGGVSTCPDPDVDSTEPGTSHRKTMVIALIPAVLISILVITAGIIVREGTFDDQKKFLIHFPPGMRPTPPEAGPM